MRSLIAFFVVGALVSTTVPSNAALLPKNVGAVVARYVGVYIPGTLAGARFRGWTRQLKATVSNGVLELGERVRVPSTYGVSMSSLQISPDKSH